MIKFVPRGKHSKGTKTGSVPSREIIPVCSENTHDDTRSMGRKYNFFALSLVVLVTQMKG